MSDTDHLGCRPVDLVPGAIILKVFRHTDTNIDGTICISICKAKREWMFLTKQGIIFTTDFYGMLNHLYTLAGVILP